MFRHLVLAWIIEPTGKADSLRVLGEVGVEAVSYPMVYRRLPVYAGEEWRGWLAAACAAHARIPMGALPRCMRMWGSSSVRGQDFPC